MEKPVSEIVDTVAQDAGDYAGDTTGSQSNDDAGNNTGDTGGNDSSSGDTGSNDSGNNGNHYGNDQGDHNAHDDQNKHDGEQTREDHHDNNGGGIVPPPPNGIVRTGMAVGPIASFGSVVVNGVHYDTTAAVITVDGVPGTQADLRVGQVVTIAAELEDGTTAGDATAVTFDVNVEGPIESLDAKRPPIVPGQTVHAVPIPRSTTASAAHMAGLPSATLWRSAPVMADGSIDATRIEKGAWRRFKRAARCPRSTG
jgi:hypothetical protein